MKSTTSSVTVQATERYEFLDLTDDLRRAVKDSGITDGAAIAFCAHTTCALLINEWEDGAMADFRRHLTELVPHDGVYYQHDDMTVRTQNLNPDERLNGHAHVKSMLLSATSHAIPVERGRAVVRDVAAPDLLRDGRAEGPHHHLPRVRGPLDGDDDPSGQPGRSTWVPSRSGATPPCRSNR